MSISDETESISAKVDPELKQKIRVRAAKQGTTMSQYVREVLTESIEADEAE